MARQNEGLSKRDGAKVDEESKMEWNLISRSSSLKKKLDIALTGKSSSRASIRLMVQFVAI